MATLTITRGLPASGKSTMAREWVAVDPQRRARINRDDLRNMAHESTFIPRSDDEPGTEQAIQATRDAAIAALLRRGVDVVCDDTNLPSRVARNLRRLAVAVGAEFDVWDLTAVPLEECLRRNAKRTGREFVPEERIRDMWAKFVRPLKGQPIALPDEPEDTAGRPYTPRPGAIPAVLVDLDGTVALMHGRNFTQEHLVGTDLPNRPVLAAVIALAEKGRRVIFMSGRSDACRPDTEAWLTEHYPYAYEALHMRAAGDQRRDAIVKVELFDRHVRDRYDVLAAFDDRNQVVAAWRTLGLTVFQVAPGDF